MDSQTYKALEASRKIALECPNLAEALKNRPALLLKAQDAFVLLKEVHMSLMPIN